MLVEVDDPKKTLNIRQELTFYNESADTLSSIVLNDWNHAYSSKTTPLAKRFSDEFVRSFHLAKDEERGHTGNLTIYDPNNLLLTWLRTDKQPDIIEVRLRDKLLPGQKVTLSLTYISKIASDRFTRYGYSNDGGYNLKYWFLTPARFEDHEFIRYSNNNLDDIANGVSDYDIEIIVPPGKELTSDLVESATQTNSAKHFLSGKNRTDFSLFIEPISKFDIFSNRFVDVRNNLKGYKVDDVQKAIIVDRIVTFVHDNVGAYPHEKLTVSQTDYDRNPFYGLNQLPSFISPFPDDFMYEIKFLKTYLNNYLKTSLRLDPRKDNWIYDAVQIYTMMKYIDAYRPDTKMMGSLSNIGILRGYYFVNLSFNGQYNYLYMLMARKNLDQPIGSPKNTLIKFNEQIAGKYRAGLSLRYLDAYLEDHAVPSALQDFYDLNKQRQVDREDFAAVIDSKTDKNTDWFFETIVDSRKIIDYKFEDVSFDKDSVSFSLKNKTGANVPISVYGIKDKQVVFKKWIDGALTDSIFTVGRMNAERLVLNYNNEVPEYNLRNNWRSLKGFSISNRPIKFNFMKDLEDPYYNQILYVPTLTYNLYDGFSPGMRLHNKTLLDKPFVFDINPAFSTIKKELIGSFGLALQENYRSGSLYNVRYSVGGSTFHYAPDASYSKITPSVTLRFRESNFRDNRKEFLLAREIVVHRDPTSFVIDGSESFQNYAVFNARYGNTRTELIHHFNYVNDLQLSSNFGKVSVEMEYRKLFEDNRLINLRFYGGSFLYNKTSSDFFSFALDRPTDYLFEQNYYGRSEDTGFYSQQLILTEGGFKSKLDTPFANQWIATVNTSYSIWNWIEAYGDAGLVKNRGDDAKFVFDSGIRLNLVTDYLELYFPVYSSNGWEIGDKNYDQKIRFIVTFDPKTLINLFTRKWF
jgi:hypothetical protein